MDGTSKKGNCKEPGGTEGVQFTLSHVLFCGPHYHMHIFVLNQLSCISILHASHSLKDVYYLLYILYPFGWGPQTHIYIYSFLCKLGKYQISIFLCSILVFDCSNQECFSAGVYLILIKSLPLLLLHISRAKLQSSAPSVYCIFNDIFLLFILQISKCIWKVHIFDDFDYYENTEYPRCFDNVNDFKVLTSI